MNDKTIIEICEFLKEEKEKAEHNLLCYSKNVFGVSAKEGFEDEWSKAKERFMKLNRLIEECTLTLQGL